ncbi:IS3 family transposase [Neisseria weixii]|uniref:IS3 family transposase n=1 Tax=Neisseria weixii TaxID=1853276 RepID=UPI0012FD36B2|nr:IS3 family transposase [Neisseria weixii]
MKLLLTIAGLPRSTFCYQLAAQSAEDKYAGLKQHILTVCRQHKGRYGYRRITAAIRHTGTSANHKAAGRLMAQMGLRAVIRQRKYRPFKGGAVELRPISCYAISKRKDRIRNGLRTLPGSMLQEGSCICRR